MAFAFGNASSGDNASSVNVVDGPVLEEIQPENIGFLALNKNTKIQLVKSKWPSDSPPSPSASLLSIAQRKGLLAAAGPDQLVVARTQALRDAFDKADGQDSHLNFEPLISIPLPMRISHVCFTSDDQYLIITAETGGGLAIYEVDTMLKGGRDPAFQIATNTTAVRSLAPNPEFHQYVAVVLTDGSLLLADLDKKSLENGQNGPILKNNVSCVVWSVKGKQLAAGLGDGTVAQLRPTGELAAVIPKPPTLTGSEYVSSIAWLTNFEVLLVHSTSGDPPDVTYHYALFDKSSSTYTFQRFDTDPAPPMLGGRDGVSPLQFILRLKDFDPNLSNLVIVTSNISDGIGMLGNATTPLVESQPIVNSFTTITLQQGRDATLPYEDDSTWPLGVALDLSATEKVKRPLPTLLEYSESPTPLPALALLSSQGQLQMWWIINDESIKKGTGYRGLVALSEPTTSAANVTALQNTPQPQATPPTQAPTFGTFGKGANNAPAFGSPAFGTPSQPSPFGASSLAKPSPWGQSSGLGASTSGSAFGQPAFGSASSMGASSSPGDATFGQPAFGSASKIGTGATSTFGAAGGIGAKSSPWGGQQDANKPAFGSTSTPGGSGFSSFASKGGFASVGQNSGQSAFASQANSPFSAFAQKGNSFGTPSSSFKTEQSFGSTVTLDSSKGGSNTGSGGFSPFVSVSNSNTPGQPQSIFGNGQSSFGTVSQESDMGDADEHESRGRSEATPTPQDRPQEKSQEKTQGLFSTGNSGFKLGSTFKGDSTAKDDLPKPVEGSSMFTFGSGFGNSLEAKSHNDSPVTPIKKEPIEDVASLKDIPKTPSIPTSNTGSGLFSTTPSFPAPSVGNSAQQTQPSTFNANRPEAAPLPPDFTKSSSTPKAPAPEAAPLPPDFTKPSSLPKAATPEAAPLPPDFTNPSSSKSAEVELPPLAGSPPVTIEAPSSGPPSSPLDEPDEEELDFDRSSKRHKEASELEGVGQRSPARRTSRPQPPGNTWSFQSLNQSNQAPPPAPSPPIKSRSPSHSPVRKQAFPTTTPIGFPKGPVFAPPALRAQESPRSPSPIRSASTPAYGMRAAVPPAKAVPRPTSRAKAPTPPPEPSIEDLSDDEDERIRAELEAPIVPTKNLEGFVTQVRPDVDTNKVKPGIPGQIERVYRDINAMIDTLGINARSLTAFIAGHNEIDEDEEKTRDDLDGILFDDAPDDWCLVEIEDLSAIEDDMRDSLDAGRVTDVLEKLSGLAELHRNLNRLRARAKTLERQLRRDSNESTAAPNAPLTTEQSYQQRTLRKAFSELQSNLREAEDSVVLLRARLANARPTSSNGKNRTNGVPTVEAVTNTILKMTAMIEHKSGDIDVLETQLRRLRVDSSEPPSMSSSRTQARGTYSLEYSDSDEEDDQNELETPTKKMPGAFNTPQSRREPSEAPSSGRSMALYHTPGSSFESPASSRILNGTSAIAEEETRRRAEKIKKRRVLARKFGEALAKKGPNVTVIKE